LLPYLKQELRDNEIPIQIATIFFGVMLFFAILSNIITSTVTAQVSPPATVQSASPPSSQKSPTVKITSPTRGQQVPVGKDLTVSGTSIDNANSNDCKVSVRVNKINPYQPATAAGTGGAASKDYSKWEFVLTSKYTTIKPGQNRITAKYECASNPALTAFSSVNVDGVPAVTAATGSLTSTTTTNAAAKQPLQQQQEHVTANNNNNPTSTSTTATPQKMSPFSKRPLSSSTSSTSVIAPQVKTGPSQTNAVNEEQQQPRRLTTRTATTTATTAPTQSSSTPRQPPISEAASSNHAAPSTLSLAPNTKELSVSTDLAKDYISRGDTQFVTIAVSNSTSNEKIAGAVINVNIHNANGLIKTHYAGTTDSSGQASFSLKISPKTNPGLYAIEVNATASGYDPNSNTRVFEVNQ
jgi:hypothetical protein